MIILGSMSVQRQVANRTFGNFIFSWRWRIKTLKLTDLLPPLHVASEACPCILTTRLGGGFLLLPRCGCDPNGFGKATRLQ